MAGRVDPTVAELDRALASLLRHGRLAAVHEVVAAGSGVALDRALYLVVAAVDDRGPLRLSELAQHQGVDISTVSRQAATLEERGLLARTPDPLDRRAALLHLTDAGRDVLESHRQERRRLLGRVLAGWDAGDRATLVRLLDQLTTDLARVTSAAAPRDQERKSSLR